MTNQEAISTLKNISIDYGEVTLNQMEEIDEAMDMAIKALGEEVIRCKDCNHRYYADNRIPSQQCYVCGQWNINNPDPDGFCSHAKRGEEI